MKIYIYLLFVLLASLNSCNFLDQDSNEYIDPKDYYSTEEELKTGLRGVYATVADAGLYGNNMLGRMALEGDEGYESYSVDEQTVGYYMVSAADNKVLTYWRSLYAGINRANLLLENINKPAMDETARSDIKGQVLFLRAYYYFMLVTKFGDVPMPMTFAESSAPEEVQLARLDSKLVYARIIEDMERAATLVSDITAYKGGGHISKSAIWGILARVNLKMAGEPLKDTDRYNDAAMWAKKVMETGFHSLNPSYQQVFINYAQDQYDTKESIWEVEFWGNNTGSTTNVAGMVGRNNGIANNNSSDSEIGYAVGMIRATSVLTDLYESADQRKDWNIAPYYYKRSETVAGATDKVVWADGGSKFQRYAGKFRREYELLKPKSTSATPINFPILRYADVLLMYAEAVNQKATPTGDEITEAYECINKVRRRGYALDQNTVAPTVDVTPAMAPIGTSLLRYIQNERGRELCFEAQRKDDLVRWGVFYERMKAVIPDITPGTSSYLVAAQTVYGNVTTRDVIWPIPTYEMGVNRNLTQNPGW